MSTASAPTINLTNDVSLALRIVIPCIYIIVAILGLIGNFIVLQIICANRFRHKSIHLLALNILIADIFFIIIFTVVRATSYAYATATWFINVNEWCKAEMYLLRLFEFVLAYTVVFMCLDRAVVPTSCWFGVRKLRSGISIVLSIWIASAYVLIPILLFKQTIFIQAYGGYLCYSTDQSIPLFWLGSFPRRTLDFIDIVFRTLFPTFLMIVLLIIGTINMCLYKGSTNITSTNPNTRSNTSLLTGSTTTTLNTKHVRQDNLVKEDMALTLPSYNRRLFYMALCYALLFMVCQLPYEIYRCVLLWNQDIEKNLWTEQLDFAIEIPLLILKLINRCANPFFYICLADLYAFRRKSCRFWCLPCLPGCIGCRQCWLFDCWRTCTYETRHCCCCWSELRNGTVADHDYVPTGLQTISTYQYRDGDRLVTKQRIVEEYETGVEPFYKNPKMGEKYLQEQPQRNAAGTGRVNETFQNDESYKVATITLNPNTSAEEHLRIKL